MEHKLPCEIVRDLLPSYADGLTSPVSARAVEAHVADCAECAALLRQMQAPAPAPENPEIDYLKALRRRNRRRLMAVVLLCALLLGGAALFFGLRSARPIPPQLQYDRRSKVLTVIGHGDYSELVLPEEAARAYQIRVQDDAFDLTLYCHLFEMAENRQELEADMVRDVSEGLRFLQDYLRQQAPESIDPARLDHRISLSLAWRPVSTLYEYDAEGGEVSRSTIPAATHWGAWYVLSLLDGEALSWRQLALAYYTDFVCNPYGLGSGQADLDAIDAEYAAAYQSKGGRLEQERLTDRRAMIDAAALMARQRGLTQWGTAFESLPLQEVFPGLEDPPEPMSMFMAMSFFAWLVDGADYEAAVRYANGADFEACFGQDFDAVWSAWQASL